MRLDLDQNIYYTATQLKEQKEPWALPCSIVTALSTSSLFKSKNLYLRWLWVVVRSFSIVDPTNPKPSWF
jgi:hypothetical protein